MVTIFLKNSCALGLLLLSACSNDKSADKNPVHLEHKATDNVEAVKIERWTPIITWDDLKIEANSNIDSTMIQSVKVKFEPYVWFEDFPAPSIDTVSKSPLDFNSNKEAKHYITAIKNGYKTGNSTFGGHYELITWGCGSPCASGVIVDRKTGKIYDLPMVAFGYEYRYNSLMLLTNPPDENGFYDLLGFAEPEIYVFDEAKKTLILLDPKGKK
ncbi:MAG TPA: hypothetical protein VK151_10095 [Fluviicola sp.]|nr:hypothetical protein [Fluviicola sp.]